MSLWIWIDYRSCRTTMDDMVEYLMFETAAVRLKMKRENRIADTKTGKKSIDKSANSWNIYMLFLSITLTNIETASRAISFSFLFLSFLILFSFHFCFQYEWFKYEQNIYTYINRHIRYITEISLWFGNLPSLWHLPKKI